MRLFHFIKGGCLVDNQHYQFSKQQVINRFRDGGEITFDAPPRRRTQPEHYDNRIWEFINSVSRDIANTLESKDKRADALVLFNDEEYEHNADEGFISISGTDENNFTLRTGNLIGFVKQKALVSEINSYDILLLMLMVFLSWKIQAVNKILMDMTGYWHTSGT